MWGRCRSNVRKGGKRIRGHYEAPKMKTTYLTGAGEEVRTALSKATSEELEGFCGSGIRAVKLTA
jgi:hypothetical protein